MKIEASTRLSAAYLTESEASAKGKEAILQSLDPVSDSLNHALAMLNKAKPLLTDKKQAMATVQAIKDALTELAILKDDIEE